MSGTGTSFRRAEHGLSELRSGNFASQNKSRRKLAKRKLAEQKQAEQEHTQARAPGCPRMAGAPAPASSLTTSTGESFGLVRGHTNFWFTETDLVRGS